MRTKFRKTATFILFLLIALAAAICVQAAPAEAASFAKSKPVITKESAYLNGQVYLKWTKVKGAKKYEIQRAVIKPKTGKTGAWKKWKTTSKLSVKVKDSGDYKYRVRAINKSGTTSKWSKAKRIFAANAKITHIGYTEPEMLFGVKLSEGELDLRVLVTNKTKSPMGFLVSGYYVGSQHTIKAINKSTGKVVKSFKAYLDPGTVSGIAKQVNPGKSQSIYIYADVSAEEWAAVKNCKFLVTSSFYPNPEVEPISTQMAVAYTKNAADSSVAAK